jgi:hypothetical protein
MERDEGETPGTEDRDASDEGASPSGEDPGDASRSSDPGEASGGEDRGPAAGPYEEMVRRARRLWEIGDNAALGPVLLELEKAPADQAEAHATARELRARLRPDPVAIALWVVSLAVFCVITYLFVLK